MAFIDEGGGSPAEPTAAIAQSVDLIAKQSQTMATSSGLMLSSAQSGGFKIEPGAADALIKACTQSLTDLDNLMDDVNQVRLAPQLGQTPGAKLVSPFTQKVATDDQGIVQAIDNSKTTLQQMVKAYTQAKQNYLNTEDNVAQSLKDIQA
jgi:hypothetical protein